MATTVIAEPSVNMTSLTVTVESRELFCLQVTT